MERRSLCQWRRKRNQREEEKRSPQVPPPPQEDAAERPGKWDGAGVLGCWDIWTHPPRDTTSFTLTL